MHDSVWLTVDLTFPDIKQILCPPGHRGCVGCRFAVPQAPLLSHSSEMQVEQAEKRPLITNVQ